MKRISLLLLILLMGISRLHANAGISIRFDFPAHANKTVGITLKYGLKDESVYQGQLNEQGQLTALLGESHAAYQGMATAKIGNDIQIDFIINGENPVLKSEEQRVNGMNISFEASPENESLQKWFVENSYRREKLIHASQLLFLYEKEDPFYPSLKEEVEALEKEQNEFNAVLEASSLFAARFLQFHSFLNNEVNALPYMDSVQMIGVRQYVQEKLDVNALYTSGFWFNILNGLLAMYDSETPFHTDFISDMTHLLEKTTTVRPYIALAENLFEICEAMDWQEQSEQLAYFLLNDGRIENPQGKIKLLLGLYKLGKGNKAPGLVLGKFPEGKQTLLVFHESACGNCEREMEELIKHYSTLQGKGVEIVTHSADIDEGLYKQSAERFPWKQKYCTYRGFMSEDFENYGIIGTPTIFLIDENGIIQGRHARLRDISILK